MACSLGFHSRPLLQTMVRLCRMPWRGFGPPLEKDDRDGLWLQKVQKGLPQGYGVRIFLSV